MPLESLFSEIESLSTQVEKLIVDKDEESCAELLSSRQQLLEQLALKVEALAGHSSHAAAQKEYVTFLRSIQTRDNVHLAIVKKESSSILSQSSQQTKVKKAIKAYQNIR